MPTDRSRLSAAALTILFVGVFFSVVVPVWTAALGWAALLAGLAGPEGRDGAWRRAVPAGFSAPLLAFAAASIASAASSADPSRASAVVARELLAGGLAAAGAGIVREGEARLAIGALLVTAAAAGAWSVYQWLVEFDGALGFSHRAYGFWHPGAYVSYGNALAVVFALALGMLAAGASAGRGLPRVAAATAAIGMLLSYTRSSWLAAGLLFTAVSAWRRALVPLVAVAVVGAAVLVLPGSDESTQLVVRVRSMFDPTAASNRDRVARLRTGAAIALDHPLLGVGPDGLPRVYPRYAPPEAARNWHLHNTYLQLLVERGPAGLAAWLAALGLAVARAFLAVRRLAPGRRGLALGVGLALCAVLVVALFNYVWEDWRIRSLALALIGLAWSPAVTGAPREADPRPPDRDAAERDEPSP